MDISKFAIDQDAVEEGVWKDIGIGNIRIKFRSPQSPSLQRVRKRLEAPYREKIRKDQLSLEQKAHLFFETMIQGGILDWENVEESGQVIPWSVVSGRRILDLKKYKDIGEAAVQSFLETDSFLRDHDEEGEKNSLTGSDGTPELKVMSQV